jgi:hypothetical protein
MSIREAGQPAIVSIDPMASPQEQAPEIPLATLWDNGDTDGSNGYSHATVAAIGRYRALLDDFVVPGGGNWSVTGFSWLMLWSTSGVGKGTSATILFRGDSAGSPGAVIATATVTGWSETATGRTWFGLTEVRAQATFNAISLGPGTYWVEFLPIGPENSYGMVKTAITGYVGWINWPVDFPPGLQPATVVTGATVDYSWRLLGTSTSAYDLGFMDDNGRSQLCVNSSTGAWQYSVLMGNGAGNIYTGPGTVVNGSGYMRLTSTPGSGFGLSLMYYTTAHRASATFYYRPDAVSSALYDANTLDDKVSCGAITPPA